MEERTQIYDEINCIVCGTRLFRLIHNGTRDNPNIDVLKCSECGLVRLSSFPSDSETYYMESGMRINDEEQNIKSIRVLAEFDDERRFKFTRRLIENKSVLDFGCGAGGYLRKAKKIASKVYGIELESQMCKQITSEEIECYPNIDCVDDSLSDSIDVVTMFHVLEHLEKPDDILQKIHSLISDGGVLIIEVPNADDALISLYDCKEFEDFTYWSPHLFLYNNSTVRKIIERNGYRIRFLGQIQRYPLSNTLYWLAKGKPGGHKEWMMLSDEYLDKLYGEKLAELGIADTIIVIAEKV